MTLAGTKRAITTVALMAVLAFSIARHADLNPAFAAGPATHATVRVGVWTLWHDRRVKLMPAVTGGGFKLRTCTQCGEVGYARETEVRADRDELTFGTAGQSGHADRLWLSGGVTLDAHGERLTMLEPVTIAAHDGTLVIVVTLPVERYVERVLASESGPDDNADSLKALAVVIRTFAIHETHGHKEYDLCDSTHCQLLHWGGNPNRSAAAHAATLATAGETLWYKGQRALAYFNKDCGGRSASPAEIWPNATQTPYLDSRPDQYCSRSGVREWASEISVSELTSALAVRGLAQPGWQNLSVGRRGSSGRAVTVFIDGKALMSEDFRLAVGESLGWNRIPSTWFEVNRQGDKFLFHGRGWGHGVGLCQKGATAMAEQGTTAQQILNSYFPGAAVSDEESGRAWKNFPGNGFVLQSLDPADAAYMPEIARARAEASARSGLNSTRPITVRAFAETSEFRDTTLALGWVAAFTEGDWIATQPLRTLAARHLLSETMRHEFLHALVEDHAGPAAPLWLREGLAEAWSSDGGMRGVDSAPKWSFTAMDSKLAHASSAAESESAHRAAGQFASRLLTRYGRATVLQWLQSGIPASVLAGAGRESLR